MFIWQVSVRTIQLQQSHKWNQQLRTDRYSKHVGAAQMLLSELKMTTRYTSINLKLKQQCGKIFLCNISKQHIPTLLFYCSVVGEDKKTFSGSKLQHSLVSPVFTRCWGEVCSSILGFNYHILRMENIACQLSWQKKIQTGANGNGNGNTAQWAGWDRDCFFFVGAQVSTYIQSA